MNWKFWQKKERIRIEQEDQEVRTSKAAVTKLQNQIRKLKYDAKIERLQRLKDELEERQLQEEIDDYENMIYGDESEEEESKGGSMEDMLMATIMGKFLNNPKQSNSPLFPGSDHPATDPSSDGPLVRLDDQVLKQHIDTIPKSQVKKLAALDEGERQQLIKNNFPDLDTDTIQRASNMIKVKA